MDDQHRQPRDSDRNPVRDRIKRAVADGRIGSADGDIRLGNVTSAQSMGELLMIVRDLDQLETSIPASSQAAAPAVSVPAADFEAAATGSRRTVWPVMILVFLLIVAGAGGIAVFAFSSGDGGSVSELGDPVPISEDPVPSDEPTGSSTDEPTDDPTAADPLSNPAYRFSADGIRTFLATYKERFGTTKVVKATFYGDYVIVQVPVAGKNRHSGWVYRQASGFQDFGGVTANFPGSAVVDLAKLNVTALIANVSRANRVLKVEDPTQTYANIDYRPQFDPAPNVNIYLANEFNESGYLATRLNGQVERSYPAQ